MHECAVPGRIAEEIPHTSSYCDQYSSVEISNGTIDFSYHFKLWTIASISMCILVKENSKIVSQLKEGDTFNMKYYTSDPLFPAEYRRTTIQNINKDSNGRFKGHFLVHLEILDTHESESTPYLEEPKKVRTYRGGNQSQDYI